MAIPTEMYYFMASYALIIFLMIAGFAFMLGGFFFPYLKVKASRHKKVLVRVLTMTNDYFRVGEVNEGFLIFKDRLKETRRLSITDSAIYMSMGVLCIDVEDHRNTVFDREQWKVVNGFDAKKYDALYERILLRPGKLSQLLMIILILVCISILAGLASSYLGYQNYKLISELGKVAATATQTVAATGV